MSEAAVQVTKPQRKRKKIAPRVVLHGVSWQTYCRTSRALAEQPGVRLTYDRGILEIMSPHMEHDWSSRLLVLLIVTLADELGLQLRCGGATTLRRKLKQRGLEPDESFWIANEHRIRGKKRLNLKVDPPPDLAVEVDVTRSSMKRLSIYAALRVPEVWRFEEDNLVFYVLDPMGNYAVSPTSLSFPGLTGADLIPFLKLTGQLDDIEIVRQFRRWVRQRFAITQRP